jgi:hypothetical protein
MRVQVSQYAESSFVQDAGMQISTKPVIVSGRVLDTPNMEFGGRDLVVCRLRSGSLLVVDASVVFLETGSWIVERCEEDFQKPYASNNLGRHQLRSPLSSRYTATVHPNSHIMLFEAR